MRYLLLLLVMLIASGPVLAEPRGVMTVELRAAPEANAPVSERVELYKSSYALVIGNDAYASGWPRLSNAVADARQVAAALEENGFEVTLKENLDSASLRDTLREFFAIKGAEPQSRLLLWYAGHGHSIHGEGFLVPVDAPAPASPEFKVRSLHMRDFGGLMRLADSKHVLAIFDSCFSGTIFTTRAGAVPAAITRVTTKPTREFMTSGDADQQVSDDGTFRRLFLRALAGETTADANGDGYLTGTELGLFMSTEMTNYTEQVQTPRYGKLRDPDYDRGDFVFALPGRRDADAGDGDAGAAASPANIDEAMAEIVLWTSVVSDDDPAVVQTYLDKYPTGHFAKAATARIEALKAETFTKPADKSGDAATAGSDAVADTKPEDKAAEAAEPDAAEPDAVAPKEPEGPAFELSGGVNLKQVGGGDDEAWLPAVGDGDKQAFQLTGKRMLPKGFFGSGDAAAELAEPDAAAARDVGPEGYQVSPAAWRYSNPQGDGQYKVDGDWIHMRAPGAHDIWDCKRGLAPILSVPAPKAENWSAQVWFQLPARIGRSHVGLVAWNGVDADRPTRALYFGPADTNALPVNGSYRGDCSASAGELAGQIGNEGPFNLDYTGGRGWLRIAKNADRLSFFFKSPYMHNWRLVGTMATESKDELLHVGLITKTWGSEPVVASFSDFRLIPHHSDVETWTPAYLGRLEKDGAAQFAGKDFDDFEWSDPAGDSINEISGNAVRLKVSGGRDIWDCKRQSAPILSLDVPRRARWTAEVDFDLPARIGRSQTGLVLWNDEFGNLPVHALYFGPISTGELGVSGSNAIDCSSSAADLRRQPGSRGEFVIDATGSRGKLRISRDGDVVSFFFRAPERRNWEHIGTTLATVRDGFSKIGLMAKTWGSEPLNVTFSNFRIITGETEPDRWFPSYYASLKTGVPLVFEGPGFGDFEWSDPIGNSVHEIRGSSVKMATTGGHDPVWDCKRQQAPVLSVDVPPRDAWVAQVNYRMPSRDGRTSAGLVLWNGAEHGAVRMLHFGPAETKGLQVWGSYSDDCSASAADISRQEGNAGTYRIDDGGSDGILRIIKFGWFFKFAYFDPATGQWTELGTLESTVKDSFSRIGLHVGSWGSAPVEAEFQNFTIVPGLFN